MWIFWIIFAGWSYEKIGNGGSGFQGVRAGEGRNDGIIRIYGACDDYHAYEFSWDDTGWVKVDMGAATGSMHDVGVGKARNDDTIRVYGSPWANEFWEFTWDGTGWRKEFVGDPGNYNYGAVVAPGRNDDTLRIYTGINTGRIIEFTYRNGAWSMDYVGGSSDANNSMHDVWVDYGRNDDTLRVYGACTDGRLWECTWDGTKWNSLVIDQISTLFWGVIVAEGRNDGVKRVYACTGADPAHGGPEEGRVFEYTWNGETWEKEEVGLCPKHLYGITAGAARNDGIQRIYVGGGDGYVYEFTYTDTGWVTENIGGPGGAWWFHDLIVERGRNDDTLRVYAGCGDHYIYEFTYRPDAKILVEPDQEDSTYAGVPVRYELWVYNLGTGGDTVDITFTDKLSWIIRIYDSTENPLKDSDGDGTPDVGYLLPHDSCKIFVDVISSLNATAGSTDTTIIFGYSSLAPQVYDTAILITRIKEKAEISVYPDQEDSILGGESIDYYLWVKNNGNFEDVIDLTTLGTLPSWKGELLDLKGSPLSDTDQDGIPDIGLLKPYGDSAGFILRITAPEDALAGTQDTTFVKGSSSKSEAEDAARIITRIKTVPKVIVEPDRKDSTQAGVPITYELYVINQGNGPDCIDALLNKGHPTWNYRILDSNMVPLSDTDGDGIWDFGIMDGFGDTVKFYLEITSPLDVSDAFDTTYVIGVSSLKENVRDSAKVITKIMRVQLLCEPDTVGITQGEKVTYKMRIINKGNLKDSFKLKCLSCLGWDYEITDSLGGLLTQTPEIMPEDTFYFYLSVTPPQRIGSLVGEVIRSIDEIDSIFAFSSLDTLIYDVAEVKTLFIPVLDIHNYPNPFEENTTFIFNIPEKGKATLLLFNRAGEHIVTLFRDKEYERGVGYSCFWDGKTKFSKDASPGLYLYVFKFTPSEGRTKTIIKKALKVK